MQCLRVLAALLSLSLLTAWGDAWLARPAAATILAPAKMPATAILDLDDDPRAVDVAVPRTDVLGNAIDDAVGDYRVDTQGDIYERHSPQTEVPRLGPAVS